MEEKREENNSPGIEAPVSPLGVGATCLPVARRPPQSAGACLRWAPVPREKCSAWTAAFSQRPGCARPGGDPRGSAGRCGTAWGALPGNRACRGLAETALVALQAWVQDRRKTSGRAPSRPSLARVPGGLCRIRAALASPSVPWESAFCRRPRPPSLLPHRLLPPCPLPSPTRRPIT